MKTEPTLQLLATKNLPHYPSASSIELYNNKLYVMGDDAQKLLVLDKDYNETDSIHFFEATEKRIAKIDKADPEASTVIEFEGKPHLFLCGSASTAKRENVFLLNLDGNNTIDTFSISSFIQKIKKQLPDVNIEGCTAYNNKIILANRANLASRYNNLIITANNFFTDEQSEYNIIQLNMDTADVKGISSLQYIKEKDWLIVTASVEETASSYADGAIGNSYIGLIKNFSSAIKNTSISLDKWIDLAALIPQLQKQKIEGLTVEAITSNSMMLHLVSDNDNGESTIYKVEISL